MNAAPLNKPLSDREILAALADGAIPWSLAPVGGWHMLDGAKIREEIEGGTFQGVVFQNQEGDLNVWRIP